MEIHVFSYGELGDIPRQYPKFSFVWHRLNMKNPGFLIKMKQIFDDCECVFDITYGDGFSDIYGKVWNANTDLYPYIQFEDGIHWNVPYQNVTIEDFVRTFPLVKLLQVCTSFPQLLYFFGIHIYHYMFVWYIS